ncbi:ATP-binding protein [Comamonas terrigena]|uniref:ATP-binding protein n=1 Tax=Comamonas terrigena TaxID=32013 RepID=UPI00244BC658|nr:ATP-binding protein [Comamonas terrigena]MDH1700283.1 ATP-binding protein [Comamonas terrigena]
MEAKAFPAKRFFVEMLTRDIDLEAAILDLLDNCVDGCLRAGPIQPAVEGKPYAGYFAKITISQDNFKIEDNCGGIEKKLAEDYAFRFGRIDSERDKDIATVGVYGIGMKRAIFKIGTNSKILSNHPNGGFSVTIDKNWMESDIDWTLPMEELPAQIPYGTLIEINTLHPGISNLFGNISESYAENFSTKLQQSYSYIIEKGFSVYVNDKLIESKHLKTLLDEDAFTENEGIAPYVYKTTYDDVEIKLSFGLYEKLVDDDDNLTSGTRTKNDAGWTVICNDRVILDNDKSIRTGWGESGVPQYHSQFIALGGYVSFSAKDAGKLPVTTTKRNIDLESPIYSSTKEEMKRALKTFTDFTNWWKSQTKERGQIQKKSSTLDIRTAAEKIPENKWKAVRTGLQGHRFKPTLPKPPQKRTHARIQFEKPIEEIHAVRDFLLDDSNAIPYDVGVAAFDWALEQAKKSK